MNKKNILVTGGSGFVGQAFISRFSKQFNIIQVSLREKTPESIDFSNIDVVLHLAGLAHSNKRIPAAKYFEINTELTTRLAHAAKTSGVGHFIFLSSVKVYGEDGWFGDSRRVLTVDSPCNPTDPYGQSKLEAEKSLQRLADSNFSVAIVRPCLIYRSDAKGNIASLVKLMMFLKIIPLGYRHNRRSIIEMKDLLAWLEKIVTEKNTGVSIPHPMKIWSLQDLLCRLAVDRQIQVLILPLPKRFVTLASKLHPQICNRLFGDLLFKSECSIGVIEV